jgi:hypothetical protein
MSVSAEHPLVGNDAARGEAKDKMQNTVGAKHENEELRPRSEDMSFAFRIEPQRQNAHAADPHDDGPIIRRIDGKPQTRTKFEAPRKRELRTPRLFPEQRGGYQAAAPEPLSSSIPAMEESLLGDQADERNNTAGYQRRPNNMNFSVSAIRAQRMRKPAGTHKPTSIVAKMAIATFVGITCISSGVTLGLYGPELGYQIERQARLASASLGSLVTWPGSDSKPVQATTDAAIQQQTANPQAAKTVGYSKPVAAATTGVTGSKRYYDRILPSQPGTSASAQVNQARPAQPAKLTGLEKYLAVPLDLQAARVDGGSTSTE